MSLELRPYQLEAREAAQLPGKKANLIVLPTGTGKTVVFSSAIAAASNATALVLAHRDELIEQAARKLVEVAPELAMDVGIVKGKRNDVGARIIVASVQTLARLARLEQLPSFFDFVVIDEAHHAAAATYLRILEYVKASRVICGFTATPNRAGLREIFELRYSKSLLEMIEAGYLADLRGVRVELDLDLSDVRRSNRGRGDFVDADLGVALEEADASDRTVDAWREHAAGRKGLVFCPTVAVSIEMAASFRSSGFRAEHLDGTTPPDRRKRILAELKSGDLEIVSNVGVLTEGFDEPSVDAVVIASPTKSAIKYAQMVGRGTRLYPGKSDCLVVDLVGVSDELALESLPKLIGAKQIRDGESASEAVEREDGERRIRTEQEKLEAERRRKAKLRSREFGFFNRERINWTKFRTACGDRFAVDVGKGEFVLLDPLEDDQYRVLLLEASKARWIAGGLELGYAQGVAENLIRERGAEAIGDNAAAWREHPATKGQIGKALHMGLRPPREATKGQVADLITGGILRERVERLDAAIAARTENATEEAA